MCEILYQAHFVCFLIQLTLVKNAPPTKEKTKARKCYVPCSQPSIAEPGFKAWPRVPLKPVLFPMYLVVPKGRCLSLNHRRLEISPPAVPDTELLNTSYMPSICTRESEIPCYRESLSVGEESVVSVKQWGYV